MVRAATIKKMLLVVGSLLFTLLLLEVGLRLYGYVPEGVPPYLFANHPRTGWTVRPDYRKTVLSPEGEIRYAINAQGFRGETVAVHRSPGPERRIFLIGDSYTFGQGVEEEATFARQLERLLRERQATVDVVNLGVPGFGTMRSYHRLREYAELLGPPALVIYTFIPNDPVDCIAGRKVVVNGIRIDRRFRHKTLLSYLGHLRFHSRLADFVLTRLYPYFSPRVQKAFALSEQEVELEQREDFRASLTYLAQMYQWTVVNGVDFLVLIGEQSEYSAPLIEGLTAAGIPYLEAERFFERFDPQGEPVQLADGHWNARGHACVARGLAEYLLQQYRDPVPHGAGFVTGTGGSGGQQSKP